MICSVKRIFTTVKVVPGLSKDSDQRLAMADLLIGEVKSQQSRRRIRKAKSVRG